MADEHRRKINQFECLRGVAAKQGLDALRFGWAHGIVAEVVALVYYPPMLAQLKTFPLFWKHWLLPAIQGDFDAAQRRKL